MKLKTNVILALATSVFVTTFVWSIATVTKNLLPVTIDLANVEKIVSSFQTINEDDLENVEKVFDGPRVAGKFFDYSEAKKEQILEYLVVKDFGIAFDVSTKLYYTQQLIESFALNENFHELYVNYEREMLEVNKAIEKANKLIAASGGVMEAEYLKQIEEQNKKVFGERIIEDKVNKVSAAPEKKTVDKTKTKAEGDLVFFSYDGASSPTKTKVESKEKVVTATQPDPIKIAIEKIKKDIAKEKAPQVAGRSSSVSNVALTIHPTEVNVGKGLVGHWSSVEFRPDYSDLERKQARSSGSIQILKSINNERSFFTGKLVGADLVDTRINLELLNGDDAAIEVPVFSYSEFEKLLNLSKQEVFGGYILAELDSATDSVEVDVAYDAKVYLDKRFRPVTKESDYRYVLLTGLEEGITSIEYKRMGFNSHRKVINVENRTIYFDVNVYLQDKEHVVSFTEQGILGAKERPLNVDPNQIKHFNTDRKVKKVSAGQYDISNGFNLLGSRKYLSFEHMSRSIFVGLDDQTKIVLPSEDILAETLTQTGVYDLENVCLIQVDVEKPVLEFEYTGRSGEEFLTVDRIFQNTNGEFSEQIDYQTHKIFLMSVKSGVISMGIKYLDGSSDYLDTSCSISTYLIEKI